MQVLFCSSYIRMMGLELAVMADFYNKLKALVEGHGKTLHQFQFDCEVPSSNFSHWKAGRRTPSDEEIEKIAGVEWLGVDEETLKAWRALDEYGKEVLLKACDLISAEGLTDEQALEQMKRVRGK